MNVPVVYPRTSVTVIEKRVESFLDKYDIGFEELFDIDSAAKKLLGKINDVNVDEIFGNFIDELNAVTYTYGILLDEVDKNLMVNLRNKYDKFVENLGFIKEKFTESQIKQNESTGTKLSSVVNSVFPDNVPQERYINVVYFINKYGFNFINELFETIEINKFNHQVISMSTDKKTDQTTLF